MAEYKAWPIWWNDHINFGDIDTSEFSISEKLKEKLNNWAKRYNDTMDWDNPYNAGFRSECDVINFYEDGRILSQELQIELGNEYEITYATKLEYLGVKDDG
ncbi:hypothetical protein [Methylopila sp. Yamaguchi]|uniref:hypothetical protein n=1 Tax=Methylopila sp. Yamaguchi TaxID=1437817 RepID=UPI000CB7D762|nr:hypothetical protein [Methylopila sp. Yamaguchi]GBD48956.1 hypothetical protein METY_2169 [Methylopila sp. Yamaguchi]